MKHRSKVAPQTEKMVPPSPSVPESVSHAASASEKNSPAETVLPDWKKQDALPVVLFSVLLFAAMTIQTGTMTLVLLAAALLCAIGKTPLARLRAHASLPALGLVALAVILGGAAIWSDFGGYAVGELNKFLAAFSLCAILLSRFEKRHVRGLLWGFATVSAAIGLICVDSGINGPLFRGFNGLTNLFGADYASVIGVGGISRVNGIYNDANVSACILALGLLLSLWLLHRETASRGRLWASMLVGVNGMAFFLSMSRGAILCFAISLLVWLFAEKKERRMELFLRCFLSALVILVLSMPAMPALFAGSLLATALTLLSGVAVFFVDGCAARRLAEKLSGRGRMAAVVAVILVAAAGLYAVVGAHFTRPYTFDSDGETLYRIVYPAPGSELELTGDWSEGIELEIQFQTMLDQLNDDADRLYTGPLESVHFTIPQEEGRLRLIFHGTAGAELRAVELSDGTSVALDYPLLPEFVSDRMQDSLLHSNSFFLRLQYLKDGWKLFTQSPLIGHGLGSTEGLLTSVQPFFYQSLYVHNHLLQMMDDAGLLGLAALLVLLGGVLLLLWKALKRDGSGLAAVLLACFVMLNLHSLMEINFSVRGFVCFIYPLLLLPVLLWAKPLEGRKARSAGLVLAASVWAVSGVLGGLLVSHRMVQKATLETPDVYVFLDTLESLVARDVFDHEQNQLNFIGTALQLNDPMYNGTLLKYAQELEESGTYPACSGVARYFYLPQGDLEGMFAASRRAIAQEASAADAWNLQIAFYRDTVLPAIGPEQMEAFLQGVSETMAYLEAYSQGRLEEIRIYDDNQAFLNTVESVQELPAEDAWQLLRLTYAATENE